MADTKQSPLQINETSEDQNNNAKKAADTPPKQQPVNMAQTNNNNTSNTTQRANKPKPLILQSNEAQSPPQKTTSASHPNQATPNSARNTASVLSIDELLDLMRSVNAGVKAGQFTKTLGEQIVTVCQQLKNQGEKLERNNKTDLNRAFVSLRQACCRDNGQLGTACRLKIMELVELRAMGWRPSLAHSQYYLNRQQASSGQAPISAPPFGSVPMNPFAAPGSMPPHMFHPGHPHHPQQNAGHFEFGHPQQQQTPSYYLVPASAGFLPPTSLAMMMGGQPSSPLGPMSATHYGPPPMSAGPGAIGGMFANTDGSIDSPWPKGAVIKHGKFPRPQRIPGKSQFRDELIIKNADSGKIMGVRGRRVAVVEELSKTVISFQKVAPTSKERTLTVTGNTEEQIEYAKLLIEETIKRNVSPNRQDGDGEDNGLREEENEDESEESDVFDESTEATDKLSKVKFETNDDGSLKLSCADPALLQAAQDALNKFFVNQVPMRKSSEQKLTAADRRKSVPSFSPEVEVNRQSLRDQHNNRGRRGSMHFQDPNQTSMTDSERALNWRNNQQRRVRTRSVPNLAEVNSTPLPPPPAPQIRARYTRDYLLQCADAEASHVPPECNEHLSKEAPDIMRQPKQFLESKEYKMCSGALMQSLRSASVLF